MPKGYNADGTPTGFPHNWNPALAAQYNTKYTPEIAEQFCGLIENGHSLNKASQAIGVDHCTPLRWYRTIPDFAARYDLAREIQQEVWHNQTIDIADGEELPGEDSQVQIRRDALRVDTRFKVLANMAPKKYGARSSMELSTPDGKPLVAVYLPENNRDNTSTAIRPSGDVSQ